MNIILKPISLSLSGILYPDDVYLPLHREDHAKLMALIPNDEDGIYLTISDDLNKEYVLAFNQRGTIVLARGVDSEPRKFPRGSCVFFENSIPVTKWLVCNHNCCDGDCPVDGVKPAGGVLPTATVGNAWEGTVVFSGDLPMAFGITGLPSWCRAEHEGNFVKLSGIPVASGSFSIAVSACNNRGRDVAVQQFTLVVIDPA